MGEIVEATPAQRRVLGWFMLIALLLLFAALITIWPIETNAEGHQKGIWIDANNFLGTSAHVRLMVMVVIAGGIGSLIYGATAFSVKVANQQFSATWLWWYFLRLPTGMALALLLYLVIRGGLFAGNFTNEKEAADTVNPYGFVALAALTGMFAEQASDKLKEIFEGLFRTAEKKGFAAKAPVIDGIPTVLIGADGDALKLQIKGRNFTTESKATVDGEPRELKFVDENTVSLFLSREDAVSERELKLRIANPANQGGASEEVVVRVRAVMVPILSGPVPAVKAGGAGDELKLRIPARSVASGATATVNGQARSISALSEKGFTLELLGSDVGQPGTLDVAITNPANTGGTSMRFPIEVAA